MKLPALPFSELDFDELSSVSIASAGHVHGEPNTRRVFVEIFRYETRSLIAVYLCDVCKQSIVGVLIKVSARQETGKRADRRNGACELWFARTKSDLSLSKLVTVMVDMKSVN